MDFSSVCHSPSPPTSYCSSCLLCSLSLIAVLNFALRSILYYSVHSTCPPAPSPLSLSISTTFPHYSDNRPVYSNSLANLEGWVTACRQQPSMSPTMTSVGTKRLKSLSRRWVVIFQCIYACLLSEYPFIHLGTRWCVLSGEAKVSSTSQGALVIPSFETPAEPCLLGITIRIWRFGKIYYPQGVWYDPHL
jgi:hypothetical protein